MVNLRELNLKLTKKEIADSVKSDTIIVQTLHALDELDVVIRKLSVALKEWYSYYAPSVLKISEPLGLIELVKKGKKEEMGGDFSKTDIKACFEYSSDIESLLKLREKHFSYLESLMKNSCSNLNSVAGTYVGAKLISLAGSLNGLSNMRSSTIQVLGAEKALFRHLKKKSKPPKFGVIFMHPSISNAKEKAKVARKLAAEISLAARKDFFRK